ASTGGVTASGQGGTANVAGQSSSQAGTSSGQGGAPVGGSGSGGASGGSAGAAATSASVLERNGGPTRESHWVQPTLNKTAAAKMTFETNFSATFQGSMFASPLYIEHGPGGKGAFIAVSADNVVTALDETTGATLWSKTLGAAPGMKGQACGPSFFDPVGILGTPVIDEKSGTIYVAAPIGTDAVERQEVHALSIADGAPRAGFPINVSNLKAGSLAFNTKFQNQRSALSLVNGIVYVAYGGFSGDCGDDNGYHGWIVAIDTSDPSKVGAFATAGQGEAIWASGGFASDGTSIFPVTGNGKATSRDASNSESILRISGLAQFQKSKANEFYPSVWKSM